MHFHYMLRYELVISVHYGARVINLILLVSDLYAMKELQKVLIHFFRVLQMSIYLIFQFVFIAFEDECHSVKLDLFYFEVFWFLHSRIEAEQLVVINVLLDWL